MKIDTLQIYYDGFINQQNQGEFFRGMADYIELAITDTDCKRIISEIPKTKQNFILENVDSEIVASKKVRLVKKDFQDIFGDKNKVEDLSFGGNLYETKTQHTFEIEKKIKDGQGTTLWDAWEKMCLAYLIIFKKDKVLTDPRQRDEYDMFIFETNPELVDKIEGLATFSKNQINIGLAFPEILAKENYNLYATKVHKYFVDKLEEKQAYEVNAFSDSEATSLGEKKSRNKDFNFPKGLSWEEIEIRFLGSEDVVIIIKGKHTPTNCEFMGFQDKKTKKPDLQWKFLQILAKKGGAISWENNRDLERKVFDTIKSKKATIKKRLQDIFRISSDPFYPYKKEKAYRIKLKLTPELDISMATTKDGEAVNDWRDVYDDSLTPKFKKEAWDNDEYNETDDN